MHKSLAEETQRQRGLRGSERTGLSGFIIGLSGLGFRVRVQGVGFRDRESFTQGSKNPLFYGLLYRCFAFGRVCGLGASGSTVESIVVRSVISRIRGLEVSRVEGLKVPVPTS